MNDPRADMPPAPDSEAAYDLAVIGGGINGCGIAADAAGRGLSVVLIEQADLGSGTSSASSKLIHGGLRYLEQYAFRLVRESLEEREVLLANAPHLIWPLRFVVPHAPHMRSRVTMRAGLFIYDHLARRRRIPASGSVDMASDPAARPLASSVRHAFHYSDCWVDDARLVVAVAQLAARHGAQVLTRTRVASAEAGQDGWRLRLEPSADKPTLAPSRREVRARALVNAAGPWAGIVSRDVIRRAGRTSADGDAVPVRLVKGSHIVVPRIDGAEQAYLLQADDGRVVFLLPFAGRFTLIGTTDVPHDRGDPAAAAISAAEERYLLEVANRFLRTPLLERDVVWRYAGVRPLYDDDSDNPSAVTRDYRLVLDGPTGAPLLTVVGGKVTTYRRLAEAALAMLTPHMQPARKPGGPWTAEARLPGGDIAGGDFDGFAHAVLRRHNAFEAEALMPLLRRYGTAIDAVIGDARRAADLGRDLGGGLREREVAYLVRHEWAREPADILWRRTKTGLSIPAAAMPAVEARLAEAIAAALAVLPVE